jgi:hypothetical protein
MLLVKEVDDELLLEVVICEEVGEEVLVEEIDVDVDDELLLELVICEEEEVLVGDVELDVDDELLLELVICEEEDEEVEVDIEVDVDDVEDEVDEVPQSPVLDGTVEVIATMFVPQFAPCATWTFILSSSTTTRVH